MAYSDLEGQLVRLKLVGEAELGALHARLFAAEKQYGKDVAPAPDLERLRTRVSKYKSFVVWELYRKTGGPMVGHFGIATYDGPAYLWMAGFPEQPPTDLIADALVLILPHFFREHAAESELYIHLPQQYEDDARDALLELGFDPVDEMVGWDSSAYQHLVLQRETFIIYNEATNKR